LVKSVYNIVRYTTCNLVHCFVSLYCIFHKQYIISPQFLCKVSRLTYWWPKKKEKFIMHEIFVKLCTHFYLPSLAALTLLCTLNQEVVIQKVV
jgi:hypothetical protein